MLPSKANFILVRLESGGKLAAVLARILLADSNIYVKDISAKFADCYGYFQIAVRLAEENTNFVTSLVAGYEKLTLANAREPKTGAN